MERDTLIVNGQPVVETVGKIDRLAQTLRDAVLRDDKLALFDVARILREAQEAAERSVTAGRVRLVN